MKHYWRSFLLIFMVVILSAGCQQQPQTPAAENWHVLFDDADIPRIQENLESPLLHDWWQEQLAADLDADRIFLADEIDYKNRVQHLGRVYGIVRREAFVYKMTGDTTRADFARKALHALYKFEKWDYVVEADSLVLGLLRGSQITKTCALAYDWLNDRLTSAEKDELLQQMGDKGCEPCYRALYQMIHTDEVVGWAYDDDPGLAMKVDASRWPQILGANNFRAVSLTGFTYGTLLLQGTDPRAEKWIDMIHETYPYVTELFDKDGSYFEGTGYLNFAAGELVQMLYLVKRHLGEDWKDAINFQNQMEFLKMTRMPSYAHEAGFVNFGDGGRGAHSSYGIWVANEFQSPEVQWLSTNKFNWHSYLSAIWYDPNFPEKAPEPGWKYQQFSIGWAIVSAGLEMDDLVVAMRSGPPANHEHGDRNSIILKAFGENLLNDSWHPTYHRTKPGWALRGSLAHNCVVIDGKGHQYVDGTEGTNASLAEAKIIADKQTDAYVTVTSDATQAYQLLNENVESVIRTLLVIPEMNFLLVLDQLKSTEPADFAARWFVENEDEQAKITVNENEFELVRPHARFSGSCAAENGLNLSNTVFPIVREEGVFPYLNVAASNLSQEQTLVMAGFATEKDAEKGTVTIEAIDSGWQVRGKVAGKTLDVKIQTGEKIPVISVSM